VNLAIRRLTPDAERVRGIYHGVARQINANVYRVMYIPGSGVLTTQDLWYARIPSGSHVTEMLALNLFGLRGLENPESQLG